MTTFAKLFRNSKFAKLGNFDGNLLVGKIVHRVMDDLYIDFGCKFNGVCKRPEKEAEKYIIGQEVRIKLRDPEMSQRFLGSKDDISLLEADITLLGLNIPKERGTGNKDSPDSRNPRKPNNV